MACSGAGDAVQKHNKTEALSPGLEKDREQQSTITLEGAEEQYADMPPSPGAPLQFLFAKPAVCKADSCSSLYQGAPKVYF